MARVFVGCLCTCILGGCVYGLPLSDLNKSQGGRRGKRNFRMQVCNTTGTSRVRRRGEAGTKLQWSDRLPLANSAAPQQALSIAQHNSLLWFFFSSNCGPSSASLTVRSPATPPYANLRAPPPVAQTRKAHPHPRAPALVASGGTTTFF